MCECDASGASTPTTTTEYPLVPPRSFCFVRPISQALPSSVVEPVSFFCEVWAGGSAGTCYDWSLAKGAIPRPFNPPTTPRPLACGLYILV